jgi:hypothetical protein
MSLGRGSGTGRRYACSDSDDVGIFPEALRSGKIKGSGDAARREFRWQSDCAILVHGV